MVLVLYQARYLVEAMSDSEIIDLLRRHGVKAVSDAAYAWMEGRPDALQAYGLTVTMQLAYRITTLAYPLMSDDDRAADLCKAVIEGVRLNSGDSLENQ